MTVYEDCLLLICFEPENQEIHSLSHTRKYHFIQYNYLTQEVVFNYKFDSYPYQMPKIKLLKENEVLTDDMIIKWKFILFENSNNELSSST